MQEIILEEQQSHDLYMRRAIALAKKGEGHVNPNPLVGAVIVKDGRIIGEGYHAVYGDLHAERNAIANLTEDAKGASIYVTLEPCCHHGKQPPCTEAIIDAGITTVYIGSTDPNALVAGKGVRMLEMAGITVYRDVLKEECDALNPIFFHHITKKTPYVIMKYAMTMDGKIAAYTGKSQWITGEAAREQVQHTRNMCMGIMVGIGTVLADNPRLTCRLENGRNPVRIICDSHLRIPMDCNIVKTAKDVPTYVATLGVPVGKNAEGIGAEADVPAGEMAMKEKQRRLEEAGVHVLVLPAKDGFVDLNCLMEKMTELGLDSILLEGGSTLNYSAMQAGIVSRVQVYMAPKVFGGDGRYTPVGGLGVESPEQAFLFSAPKITVIGEDVLLEYDRLDCQEEGQDISE